MADETGALKREVVPEPPLAKRLWRGAQALFAAGVAMVPIIGAVVATHPREPGVVALVPLIHLFVGSGVLVGLSSLWLKRRTPDWERKVTLGASLDGAKLGEGELVPRNDLLEATVTPRDTGTGWWLPPILKSLLFGQRHPSLVHEVELKRRGRFSYPLRFVARSLDEARAIVEALGLDVTRRALTRKVMSPALQPKVTFSAVAATFVMFFAATFLTVGTHNSAFAGIFALPVLGMVTLQVLGLIKTKVTIGADGVTSSWLGRKTTVPLTDVASLEVIERTMFSPGTVRIHRKSGAPFELLIGLRGNNPFEPFSVEDESQRIMERIRDAMAKGVTAEPVEFRAWAERRQGMPEERFVAALRGALEAYRDGEAMPFTRTELWAVLENVRATELERVAAAIALGPAQSTLDDKTRAHFEEVRASTALPRLELALSAIVRGDEARLTRALGELLKEEVEARKKIGAAAPRVRVQLPDAEPSEAAAIEEQAQEDEAHAKRRRE
jgi:hypothetical protein